MANRLATALAATSLFLTAPVMAKDYDPSLPSAQNLPNIAALDVATVLKQEEIATDVDIGRVAISNGGGGLLGALIMSGTERDKVRTHIELAEQRANGDAAELREALAGFDVQSLARGATQQAFPASTGEAGEDPAAAGRVTYSYGLSPDFTQIRIVADIALPGVSAGPSGLLQQVTAVVELPNRSYENHENARRWAANGAAPARTALEVGFARLGSVIPQLISIDKAAFAKLSGRKQPKIFSAGFYGPEILRDATGPVIWTDRGAVVAEPLPRD
jgi:hypothetical protein